MSRIAQPSFCVIVLVVLGLFLSRVAAASDFYLLRLQTSPFGIDFVSVELNNTLGSDVSGWSFGVCHDPAELETTFVELGAALSGITPDFESTNIYPGGWTAGVILSLDQMVTLPPGEHTLHFAEYLSIGTEFFVDLELCNTLGAPPVPIEVQSTQGVSTPETLNATYLNGFADPSVIYDLPDKTVHYFESTGNGQFEVETRIYPALIFDPNSTGFSMAVEHDPQYLQAVSVEPAGAVAALFGGMGPEFFSVNLLPSGWTAEVIYDLTQTVILEIDYSNQIGLRARYATQPIAFSAGECVATFLEFSHSLGVPNRVLTASGYDDFPAGLSGLILIGPEGDFLLRGDCNTDAAADVADPVFLLTNLFANGSNPTCDDACDFNDDGMLDIADAVFLLAYLFANGPAPSAPHDFCGVDPTQDSLGCGASACP